VFNKSRALRRKVPTSCCTDGYRVLYAAGRSCLRIRRGHLEEMVDASGGYMLACTADYYADRGL
jgi:hypothetical protein